MRSHASAADAEWAVFSRERMVGLRLAAYLASKMILLSLVGLVQCGLLLFIVRLGCRVDAPWPDVLAGLFLSALVGTAIGLTSVSAHPYAGLSAKAMRQISGFITGHQAISRSEMREIGQRWKSLARISGPSAEMGTKNRSFHEMISLKRP